MSPRFTKSYESFKRIFIFLTWFYDFRGISHYLKQSTQQLHTSIKVLAAKDPQDSSSSSDSSDSDSEKEDNKAKKPLSAQVKTESDDIPKISETNERLNILLQKITEVSNL